MNMQIIQTTERLYKVHIISVKIRQMKIIINGRIEFKLLLPQRSGRSEVIVD